MGDNNDLTARENEVLALAWQCFDTEPKIDMNKLASLTGYTPGSAAVTLGKIKRKLKAKTAGISQNNPTPKKSQGRPRTVNSTPRGGASKRAAARDDTPSKRQKRQQREETDDDEEFSTPKVKKEQFDEQSEDVSFGFMEEMKSAARQEGGFTRTYAGDDNEDLDT